MAITINGSGITSSEIADGTITTDDIASGVTGKVLQVVHDTDVTEASSASATLADTGLEATITPSNASNSILIIINHTGLAKYGGTSNSTRLKLTVMKDGSQIALMEDRVGYDNTTGYNWVGGSSLTLKETAGSTSAITFKTQFARQAGDGTVRINDDNCVSSITLMEVSA